MKVLIVSLCLLSTSAFAHIKPGVHSGLTSEGKSCSMNVGETFFLNGMQHPLNERIQIQVEGVDFLVEHPAIIDVATVTASFNHDLFHGVVPTKTGAQALVINMVHSETFEGPSGFTFIENFWKTGEKKSLTCVLK